MGGIKDKRVERRRIKKKRERGGGRCEEKMREEGAIRIGGHVQLWEGGERS